MDVNEPPMNDVCAALRTILDEALILMANSLRNDMTKKGMNRVSES